MTVRSVVGFGVGTIARLVWLKWLRQEQLGVRLAGLCDVAYADGDRAQAAQAEFGCPVFADPEAMLAQVRPDAAFISTWSDSHAQLAEACMRAGVRKLGIEKPPAANVEGARRIAALAHDVGADVRYDLHWLVLAEPLLDFVRQRGIGQVHTIVLQWLLTDPARLADDVLIDRGPHFIAVAEHLLDWQAPRFVAAYLHGDDVAHVNLQFGDALATGELQMGYPGEVREHVELRVVGDSGTARTRLPTTLTDAPRYRPTITLAADDAQPPDLGDGMRIDDARMELCRRWWTGSPPLDVGATRGAALQAILDETHASAQSGGRQRAPDIPELTP